MTKKQIEALLDQVPAGGVVRFHARYGGVLYPFREEVEVIPGGVNVGRRFFSSREVVDLGAVTERDQPGIDRYRAEARRSAAFAAYNREADRINSEVRRTLDDAGIYGPHRRYDAEALRAQVEAEYARKLAAVARVAELLAELPPAPAKELGTWMQNSDQLV